MSRVAILGSGMAGLGAAYRLNQEGITPVMYEKNAYYGGQTASFRYDGGFIFDIGPHISYTKDTRIQNILAESVDQQFQEVQVNLNNYWRSFRPRHPVQLHLHGLPTELVVKIISEFVEQQRSPDLPARNYAEWLIAGFGRTFAELFPMQYARKYHCTSAENMSTDWLGPRFYRPSLEEVLRGALSSASPNIHYVTDFRYPTEGGFASYLKKFIPLATLKLRHQLVALDPRARRLFFENGTAADYNALVSSIPLPELIPLIRNTPQDVLDACRKLACSTCVLVNLGIDREDLSDAHMTYFYDEDFCFSRISFPHMLSPRNAPAGTGSIQAEVYFSNKYKPLTGSPDDWIGRVVTDLRRSRVLRDEDRILFSNAMLVRYAFVTFDLERADALETVHGYLDDLGISYCGRYGDWAYLWTDESFKSGERAADTALSRLSYAKE